jgi:hypothetical protein
MNRLFRRTLAATAFPLLAAHSMQAADVPSGVLVGLAAPTGGFKDVMGSVLGAGLGYNVLEDFGGGLGPRPTVEAWASKRTGSITLNNVSLKGSLEASMAHMGADYLYGVGGSLERGFYLLGGMGLSLNEVKVSGSIENQTSSASEKTTKPYFRAGVGYQFKNWFGTELNYSTTRSPGAKDDALNLGTVNLAATFRFR